VREKRLEAVKIPEDWILQESETDLFTKEGAAPPIMISGHDRDADASVDEVRESTENTCVSPRDY
jgi:hypothetical protein